MTPYAIHLAVTLCAIALILLQFLVPARKAGGKHGELSRSPVILWLSLFAFGFGGSGMILTARWPFHQAWLLIVPIAVGILLGYAGNWIREMVGRAESGIAISDYWEFRDLGGE